MVELSLTNRLSIVICVSLDIGKEIAGVFAKANGDVELCSCTYVDVAMIIEELNVTYDGHVVPWIPT